MTTTRSSSMCENDADTDAEIAAAAGEVSIEEVTMNASSRPALAAAVSPFARSTPQQQQQQLWHKRLGGGGEAAPAVVSVVVEVGLKHGQQGEEAGPLGGGALRINAEVAYSACGRRTVRSCFWPERKCSAVLSFGDQILIVTRRRANKQRRGR